MNSATAREVGRLGVRSSQNAAAIKRDLRAGRITLSDALDDPRAASVSVFDLCLAVPKWGRQRVPHLLARANVRSNLRIRELRTTQVERLRLAWEDPAYEAPSW